MSRLAKVPPTMINSGIVSWVFREGGRGDSPLGLINTILGFGVLRYVVDYIEHRYVFISIIPRADEMWPFFI